MKLVSWNCHGLGNLVTVSKLRQILAAIRLDVIFLCETRIRRCDFDRIMRRGNMDGAFSTDSNGRRGGIAVLWNEACKVSIQSYPLNHVDMLVETEGVDQFLFTGFYGFPELSLRNQSWELLRDIGSRVNEDWVIGGISKKSWTSL